MTTTRRNVVDLEEISTDIDSVSELVSSLNNTIVELNYILRSLTLSNLDGELKTVVIPANTVKRVAHRLRMTPKHRIILRQSGGGLIVDGKYTKNWIELENTGSSEATLNLLIVKD